MKTMGNSSILVLQLIAFCGHQPQNPNAFAPPTCSAVFSKRLEKNPIVRRHPNVLLFQANQTIESVVEQAVAEKWQELEDEGGVLQQVADPNAEYRRGFLAVVFLCFLYSTASPLWHYASMGASPAPPLLLNAANAVVALGGLLTFGGVLEDQLPPPPSTTANEAELDPFNPNDELPTSVFDYPDAVVDASLSVGSYVSDDENNHVSWGGLELGLWRFLGASAHVYGLSLTTVGHGAFLTQLSTLIVPVIQGMRGETIPNRVKVAVGVALLGVFCLTQDGSTAAKASAQTAIQWQGDVSCILAALCYSIYDIQTYKWAKVIPRRELVISKILTQAVLSVALCATVSWSDVSSYLQNNDLTANASIFIPVVLYSGLVINGLATYLQINAMNAVGPTRAQLVFASTPLWSALLAYLFLGETIGVQGAIGGLAFLFALFLAATTPKEN